MITEIENDERFPDNSPVWVWYPPGGGTNCPPRDRWSWLPGSVISQCGPDEWHIVVEVRELATLADGSPPRRNTPGHKLYYPMCYRDASELRTRTGETNEP